MHRVSFTMERNSLRIHFLTSDGSWILPHVERLVKHTQATGHESQRIAHHEDLAPGDLLFILGYLRILPDDCLDLHDRNLVVHESDLPKGRGHSPMSWQILEDARQIPFCLFEAVSEVDAGPIYDRRMLHLEGTEVHHEWRELQGLLTVRMVLDFVDQYPEVTAEPQSGEPTYFERRTRENDEIDGDEPFRRAFHKIRVCDPDEYPAWFEYEDRKFTVHVEPLEEETMEGPG